MKSLKEIEVKIADEVDITLSKQDKVTATHLREQFFYYLEGLDFCFRLIVKEIAYLEKKQYDDSMKSQS